METLALEKWHLFLVVISFQLALIAVFLYKYFVSIILFDVSFFLFLIDVLS